MQRKTILIIAIVVFSCIIAAVALIAPIVGEIFVTMNFCEDDKYNLARFFRYQVNYETYCIYGIISIIFTLITYASVAVCCVGSIYMKHCVGNRSYTISF